MRIHAAVVAAMLGAVASSALAAPDAAEIAAATGLSPETQGDVIRVSVPRSDLAVAVQGYALRPFQGLTSWAAFMEAGGHTMVMGDVVLAEGEVGSAMNAALDAGLEVTALHNHFLFESPRVFFMHIGGTGETKALATAVAAVFAAQRSAKDRPVPALAGSEIPSTSAIDPAPLAAVLSAQPQAKDGMAKFVFGRTARMHGTEIGSAMGVNTWAVFAGNDRDAVVDGDFAMLEEELQTVLKTLCKRGFHVVAIHNHMTHEEPRIVFLHYWARGPAADLARTIRAALDTQKP
jgi:Domain of Unknown Function (DUF1259)